MCPNEEASRATSAIGQHERARTLGALHLLGVTVFCCRCRFRCRLDDIPAADCRVVSVYVAEKRERYGCVSDSGSFCRSRPGQETIFWESAPATIFARQVNKSARPVITLSLDVTFSLCLLSCVALSPRLSQCDPSSLLSNIKITLKTHLHPFIHSSIAPKATHAKLSAPNTHLVASGYTATPDPLPRRGWIKIIDLGIVVQTSELSVRGNERGRCCRCRSL